MRWKPKFDERYYFIGADGRVEGWTRLNKEFDNAVFSFGNCFKSKKDALAAAKVVKKALLKFHGGK